MKFFINIKSEKIGQKFGFVLVPCVFIGFFYFLLFRGRGYLGVFLAVFLVSILYFLGRLINKIIYGRRDTFF